MSGKYSLLLSTLLGIVILIGICIKEGNSIPVESTTVKILVPPPDDSDDDAVIIEAGDGTTGEVGTEVQQDFNAADCLLPKSKGPCRAVIDSWYYSTVTKSCEPFAWSGCGGNNNRFSEKAFCETHCSKEKLTGQVSSPSVTPILFPSGTSTTVAGKNGNNNTNCPEFDGCGPLKCATTTDPVTGCHKCECTSTTANGPKSETTLETKLPIGSVSGNPDLSGAANGSKKPEKPEDVCHLPETRGNCRAMMTRWRYNPEIKECVQFHFGGCDGNTNNFVSKEKCSEFCKGQ